MIVGWDLGLQIKHFFETSVPYEVGTFDELDG